MKKAILYNVISNQRKFLDAYHVVIGFNLHLFKKCNANKKLDRAIGLN